MKVVLTLFLGATLAAGATWLDQVAPVMTGAEKKLYLSLDAPSRAQFEDDFWTGKSVTAEEYFKRIQYVDMKFGSSKTASGANTDPGRVYLALGPPTKITRVPSSRIFVPLEIWYYDIVPGILNTEVRLIFYQKNSLGLPRLYSPTADTIRALLLPQAGTRSMFGPNDSITESDIRKILKVPPAEEEIISAAVNVATGIKYSGNDEILGQISSPQAILRKAPQTRVNSRLILARPKTDVLLSPSPYGGIQVDLRFEASAQREIRIEVLSAGVSVYQNQLQLEFPKAQDIEYTHRLDLLSGAYNLMISVDGHASAYPLSIKPTTMSEIFRTDPVSTVEHRQTPFEFDGRRIHLNPAGKYAAVALARPSKVTWMLRRGAEVLWRSTTDPQAFALVELPTSGIAPGAYQLEAVTAGESRTTEYVFSKETRDTFESTLISFNANLAPASRLAFLGHQWLLQGNLAEARKNLTNALAKAATPEATVELARVEALEGHLDEARDRVSQVLTARPNDFQALAVLAYVETRFQDYSVAADLYRRALAVQDSPALRLALAQLPKQ